MVRRESLEFEGKMILDTSRGISRDGGRLYKNLREGDFGCFARSVTARCEVVGVCRKVVWEMSRDV